MTPQQAGTSRLRLFVAVVPSPPAVAHLRRHLAAARLDGLRAVPAQQWHVTLAFVPTVPVDQLAQLEAAVRSATAGVQSFDLRLRGAGRFGDRVLWAGVDGSTTELGAVADRVRAELVGAGVGVETRPFRPHLTLARAERGADQAATVRGAVGALSGYSGPAWPVDAVHLFRSAGGRHELLATSRLS